MRSYSSSLLNASDNFSPRPQLHNVSKLSLNDQCWIRTHIDPPRTTPFNWRLSLALDACIIALEAANTSVARATFRKLKRQLESGIR